MGDIIDMWESKEDLASTTYFCGSMKQDWLNYSLPKVMQKLIESGCKVEEKNGGCHWVVTKHNFVFDYWATKSRKWILRGSRKKGRGFNGIINFLGRQR